MFEQRPQEPGAWAALPGEPADQTAEERLDEAPSLDPMDVGLSAQCTTTVFPVKAPAPEMTDVVDTGE